MVGKIWEKKYKDTVLVEDAEDPDGNPCNSYTAEHHPGPECREQINEIVQELIEQYGEYEIGQVMIELYGEGGTVDDDPRIVELIDRSNCPIEYYDKPKYEFCYVYSKYEIDGLELVGTDMELGA